VIGSLRGRLLSRSPGAELLVEVHGIGYRVQTTASAAARLKRSSQLNRSNQEVFLHVHHAVREDAEQLYGFVTEYELQAFEALISAHRVGPALALAILDVHSPEELRRAVAFDDVDALCLVPGVGPKTAVRMLVELKSKLDLPEAGSPPGADSTAAAVGAAADQSVMADVRSALAGLGYGTAEIRLVMAELGDIDSDDPEVLIREALRLFAGGRFGPSENVRGGA